MKIRINGEEREIPDGLSVTALLVHLGMGNDHIAIERNFNILPRNLWAGTPVQPDDSFEIVHFVGGG